MSRALALSGFVVGVSSVLGGGASGAPPPSPAPPPPSSIAGLPPAADGGFHMEPRPVIDDVFGDPADYRRTIDRFLTLSDGMQRTRDQFARAVQATLTEVSSRADKKAKKCPEAEVAKPYARALALGQRYLRTGRELARRHEELREFDRLGETVGLTPDYRVKVKRVFAEYAALLVDYREMKTAFHDQLGDELRFAGCDLDKLVARAAATAQATGEPQAQVQTGDGPWPASPGDDEAKGDAGGDPEPAATPPATPPQGTPPARTGILFYVDNTRCPGPTRVELDGSPLGEVPGQTRSAFQTTPGPHELCLLPVPPPNAPGPPPKKCGDSGTIRRSYLHDGWTIALRCGE